MNIIKTPNTCLQVTEEYDTKQFPLLRLNINLLQNLVAVFPQFLIFYQGANEKLKYNISGGVNLFFYFFSKIDNVLQGNRFLFSIIAGFVIISAFVVCDENMNATHNRISLSHYHKPVCTSADLTVNTTTVLYFQACVFIFIPAQR